MASKKGKSNSTSKAISASTDSEKQGGQSDGTNASDPANSSVTSASAEATNVTDNVKANDIDAKGNSVKNGVKADNSSEKDTHQATDAELKPVAAVKGKAKSARTSKKTAKAQEVKAIDHRAAAVSEVSEAASETPPIEAQPQPMSKKAAKEQSKEQSSEKTGKKKRLTLDISKSLHKAIKAKAVEEGIPMVDMLRSLLEENYGK